MLNFRQLYKSFLISIIYQNVMLYKMNIVDQFKHLPSSLGIEEISSHSGYLYSIIEKELKNLDRQMQGMLQALMISFKSNREHKQESKEIQEQFLKIPHYRNQLVNIIRNIKVKFNMIN